MSYSYTICEYCRIAGPTSLTVRIEDEKGDLRTIELEPTESSTCSVQGLYGGSKGSEREPVRLEMIVNFQSPTEANRFNLAIYLAPGGSDWVGTTGVSPWTIGYTYSNTGAECPLPGTAWDGFRDKSADYEVGTAMVSVVEFWELENCITTDFEHQYRSSGTGTLTVTKGGWGALGDIADVQINLANVGLSGGAIVTSGTLALTFMMAD